MVARLKEQSPEFRQLLKDNLKLSRAFHEEFGRYEGVVTLGDGVQYLVLRRGPVGGAMPRAGDTVVVDAKVQLLDGTVLFDEQNAPVDVDDIVPGAAEVLTMMKVGDRFQIAVPPSRAHGAQVDSSIIAEGCYLDRCDVRESLVSNRTQIGAGARITRSVLLGADYYEEESSAHATPLGIGRDVVLDRVIVDKNARIGDGVRLVNEAGVQEADGDGYYIRNGIIIVPKEGVVRQGTIV